MQVELKAVNYSDNKKSFPAPDRSQYGTISGGGNISEAAEEDRWCKGLVIITRPSDATEGLVLSNKYWSGRSNYLWNFLLKAATPTNPNPKRSNTLGSGVRITSLAHHSEYPIWKLS